MRSLNAFLRSGFDPRVAAHHGVPQPRVRHSKLLGAKPVRATTKSLMSLTRCWAAGVCSGDVNKAMRCGATHHGKKRASGGYRMDGVGKCFAHQVNGRWRVNGTASIPKGQKKIAEEKLEGRANRSVVDETRRGFFRQQLDVPAQHQAMLPVPPVPPVLTALPETTNSNEARPRACPVEWVLVGHPFGQQ